MYPTLFRIGTFEVTTFGAMVALGAAIGLWIFTRELKRSGLPEGAADAAMIGVAAGLAGAKLLWVFEHLGEEPAFALLTSRGGLSWFGGLFGGVGAGLLYIRWRGWRVLPIVSAATPALAVGHAIGRIGCFLVGDDYGRPTSLPWGVAFPEGLPPTFVRVHPTQLYEMAALLPIAWLLIRWRRAGRSDTFVVGAYLVLAGTVRFAIEFLRVNVRVLGPLTVAHLGALAIIAIGFIMLARARAPRAAA